MSLFHQAPSASEAFCKTRCVAADLPGSKAPPPTFSPDQRSKRVKKAIFLSKETGARRSVIVGRGRNQDQNMAPRLPRPLTALPGNRRRAGGPKCSKCTSKSSNSLKYESAQEISRRLKCCRRLIVTQPTEQYAMAISEELRTVFK